MAKKWTKEEEDLLRQYYLTSSASEIGVLLGRSESAINSRISRLGLSGKLKEGGWTKEEEFSLRELYLNKSNAEIAVLLCRTESAVKVKLSKLGISHGRYSAWKSAEECTLRELYLDKSACEIGAVLGRSTSSIEGRIREIGLSGKGTRAKSHSVFVSDIQAITPELEVLEKYRGNDTYLTVLSTTCQHTWRIHPNNFLSEGTGRKCPICLPGTSKSPEVFEAEVKELAPDLELLEKYVNNKTRIKVKSKVCGHEWDIRPNSFLQMGCNITCPMCTPKGISKAETALGDFLSKYTEVVRGNRKLLSGREIDIYLPEFNLGIEYNGLHWHSEKFKHETYHIEKTELAASKGIKLIHVFEHEDMDIVKSRLLSIVGNSNYKIDARETEVREIDFPKEFLEANHLYGSGRLTETNLGLFYCDDLIDVMTFGKPNNNDYECELVRYCSLLDITVVDGASKLLKYFIKNYSPETIMSYSDKRWDTGELYRTLGFSYKETTEGPDYFYHKGMQITNIHMAAKNMLKKLVPKFYDEDLSEKEIMNNAGWFRVYDCGHDIWVYTPK